MRQGKAPAGGGCTLSSTPLYYDFLHPLFLDLHFCLPQCCSNHQLCGRLGFHKDLTKMEK